NLEISIENGNTVSVPLADITSGVDTNTTITSYAIDGTNTNLVITDSESNTFSVALADIAALVDTDTQYTAGTGLDLTGTVFSADSSLATDAEVTSAVAASDALDLDKVIGNESVTGLTFDGTTLTLAQDGAASETVVLSAVDTDEQDLQDFEVNGANLEISIENGNT
ncbi:hypothetical protein, partial [uncultured Maribacter sp.]|uniref:hypothetical protein n=1 Tax=uncultured Maribacter sp. TaxID=431308 RepID=UPI002609040C